MRFRDWSQYRKFLLLGGALFLVLSLAGTALEARYLRATALALAEREGTLLGRHLGALYFQPGIFLNSAGDLQIPGTLTEPVREDLQELGIVMLKVYNLRGTIVASTDPAFVGMDKRENASLRAALEGRTVGKVATREYYRNLYGRESSEDLFELYVPLWSPGRNAPEVVLEIYRPWALYQPLIRAGMVRTAVVTVVLTGCYFLLVLLYVRKTAATPDPERRADGGSGRPSHEV
jgi:hypothetical protein